MSLFDIKVRSSRPNRSLLTPAAAAERGVAFIEDVASPGTAKLADGTLPIVGFLSQKSTVAGPTIQDQVMPGRTQLPVKAGDEASFEYAEEVEAEGSTYLDAALISSHANGTKCSFVAGKFKAAATTQVAEFVVVENMTPEVAGNVRLRLQRIEGAVTP
jgi:hypothetical protein